MPDVAPARRSYPGFRAKISIPILAALVTGLAVSCGPPAAERDPGPEDDISSSETSERGDSAGPERGVSFRQLANDGEEFHGERVTVSATVARVVQPEAFTLVSDEPAGDEEPVEDEAVLVVSSEPLASDLSEEQGVRVEGEVRPFELQEIEEELDVDLRGSLRADCGGRPAIVADTVRDA